MCACYSFPLNMNQLEMHADFIQCGCGVLGSHPKAYFMSFSKMILCFDGLVECILIVFSQIYLECTAKQCGVIKEHVISTVPMETCQKCIHKSSIQTTATRLTISALELASVALISKLCVFANFFSLHRSARLFCLDI